MMHFQARYHLRGRPIDRGSLRYLSRAEGAIPLAFMGPATANIGCRSGICAQTARNQGRWLIIGMR